MKLLKYVKTTLNQYLVGKYLGNFHLDFKMAGASKTAEIYSTETLFLGKKTENT